MRTEIDLAQLSADRVYRLLTASVVPRPIAWVSTRSVDGVDNLAPHSFFTIASDRPPVVQFTSVGEKDSLRNVRDTGEFVVCLSPEPLQQHINESATDFPSDVSEFDAVGIEREASVAVAPPRVKGSPIALECRLHQLVEVGRCTVVMGEVVHVGVATEVLGDDGLPLVERLQPMARLGRNDWSTLGDVRGLAREPYADRQARLGE